MNTLLERRIVPLDLTEPTEPDEEKDTTPRHRHGKVGVDVPPILLQEQEDGTYLVRDGHHRRLLAIAAGDEYIEAYITPFGWKSPSGSPFPYFWERGEATVEWRGVEYDYGDMWGGAWRDAHDPLRELDQDDGECDSCDSEPDSAPASRPLHCLRVSCCGPFGTREPVASERSARYWRVAAEVLGQGTLFGGTQCAR